MVVGSCTLAATPVAQLAKHVSCDNLPSFDTTCQVLHAIELSLIPKSIGDGKRHNNDFIVRARARGHSKAMVDVDLNND